MLDQKDCQEVPCKFRNCIFKDLLVISVVIARFPFRGVKNLDDSKKCVDRFFF